ncbi:MAG: phosphoribosyl-ATP diphosphatase [Coriobacteriales bacterium]|jgi:phosphoribosyl-ATP pyrophosphohydrolase|nr:phosphoribosyl-ATP diphosphatase [Coriobacteriales bacterium]
MGERTTNIQNGDLGETLARLTQTIRQRRTATPDASYTARLLTHNEDELLKKIGEEATELVLAVKDHDHDHIRYEAGDLLYHLLVLLERTGISPEELAGELDARMK